MKKILLRILVALLAIVLIIAPFLLLINFERFLPFVLFVWMLSVSYFIFIKAKN